MNLTKIKVNKEDVSCGIRGHQAGCAIANALNRTCEEGYEYLVEVDEIVRRKIHTFKLESYPISIITTLKILAFDTFGRMSPFSLEIPSHWLKKEFKPVYGTLLKDEVSPQSVASKEYCEVWQA
jgi:hypothetical protein